MTFGRANRKSFGTDDHDDDASTAHVETHDSRNAASGVKTLMFHLPVWDAVLQAWSILELSVDTYTVTKDLFEMANRMPHNLGRFPGVTCVQLDRNETTVGCRTLLYC